MRSYPLLIGGCPRSGTTALLQLLNSSQHAFISSEENILKSFQTLKKLLGTRERRSAALSNGMRALSPRETLTTENIHSHNFEQQAAWPTLRFIYDYHHKQLRPSTTLELWGDKLPAYFRDIETILKIRDVQYIHITRNPLDVVNSMLRRLAAANRGEDWWKSITEFDAMLEEWATAYRAIISAERRENVHHLHYEELVFNYQKTINEMNHFLMIDLAYHNDQLISDPDLHFDRNCLTDAMAEKISAHPAVKDYIERYHESLEYPQVASAAKSILQFCRNQ